MKQTKVIKKNQQLKYSPPTWLNKETAVKWDIVLILLGLATIALTIVFIVKIDSGRQYTFPMLFAPVGTFIRERFSKINMKVEISQLEHS